MPDVDGSIEQKEFYLEIPAKNEAFFLKGSGRTRLGNSEPAV